MRFWHKIFCGTLLIFVLFFDIGVFTVLGYSYQFNLERERESALRERELILSSVLQNLEGSKRLSPGAAEDAAFLLAAVQPLGQYYAQQGVLLALWNQENCIYRGSLAFEPKLAQGDSVIHFTQQQAEGKRMLLVSGRVEQYPHLQFVYARDITRLLLYRQTMGKLFLLLNAVICAALGFVLFFLLRRLTRPIRRLNERAREIAAGDYQKRAELRGGDELAELGRSFNRMADSVQHQVEQLTQLARERQLFIDNLAHEMKTPLTSMLGYTDYLQNALHNEQERRVAAEHLHQAAQRLENLHGMLMELTVLHSGACEMQPVAVRDMFRQLQDMTSDLLTHRELTLHTTCELEALCGNETMLLSLLQNLIENAARASERGGEIRLNAWGAEHPVIAVSDDGCGIPQEELARITEPFYRVDHSRSRQFGGVGLGLALCNEICRMHGARLEIQSELGRGTSVCIYFTSL